MIDLTKDLAVLVAAVDHDYWTADFAHAFIREHHATIQQNAEDAKRLRALERAMDEEICLSGTLDRVRKRANEILREGEGL